MQAILDSLPEHVRNFKDIKGKTIIDSKFYPFSHNNTTNAVTKLTKDGQLIIIRPCYVMETIECKGEKLKVMKKVEGNIQDAIDNKVKNVLIHNRYNHPCNSFEDDVYKLLDAGHIQVMILDGELKSNGKQYHVDFIHGGNIGDNITSYINFGRETAKTVVLKYPKGPVANNLITLGWGQNPEVYPDTITSKFIGHTKYTNARNYQDILDMIAVLKTKIESL